MRPIESTAYRFSGSRFYSLVGSIFALLSLWALQAVTVPDGGFEQAVQIDLICPPDTTVSVCDPLECIEFETFNAGDLIDSVGTRFGPVRVMAVRTEDFNNPNPPNAAMVFNTGNPTGGDFDLGTPNEDFGGPGIGEGGSANSKFRNDAFRGNVLIVTTNFDSENPNDNARGGTITFDFSLFGPIILHSLSLVDGEELIELTAFANGQIVATASNEPAGDNGFITLDLGGVPGVESLEVTSDGSFSVDQLCFSKGYYPGFPEVVGSTDPNPSITFTDNIIPGATPEQFTIERTFEAVDNDLNIATCTQIIRVEDQGFSAPEFECPADIFLGCNPTAIPAVAFENPLGLFIQITEDTIFTDCQGNPSDDFINVELRRTFIASDDCGLTDTCTQSIFWKEDTTPPDLSRVPVDTLLCPFDPYLDTVNFIPPGIFDNCGIESVQITEIDRESIAGGDTILLTRTLTAFDSCQNQATLTQTIRLVTQGLEFCGPVCPPDTFLGCNPATFPDPLPDTLNGITVQFRDDTSRTNCLGGPAEPLVNVEIIRTYLFSDDTGFQDSCQQAITWKEDELPPDLTALPLDTTLCPLDPYLDTVNFIPIGIDDNCGIEQVRITELSRDTVANGDTIIISRSILAIDSCQNEALATQIIRLTPRSEGCTVTCPPDTFLGCNPVAFPEPLPDVVNGISVTFSDDTTFTNCAGDPIAPFVNVDVIRTYVFTTDFGLQDSCQQRISWKEDQLPPDLTALPVDTTLCPLDPYLDTVNFIPIGIEDNCGIEQVRITELSRDTIANGDTILITRSVLAIDSCQNEATATQTIRLTPRSEGCTVVCPPDTFLGCNPVAFPDPLPDQVNGITVTFSDDTTFTNCAGEPTEPFVNVEVLRTYVFTTDFGLQDSCRQVIAWKNDTIPPDLTALPIDTTLCPLDPYLDTASFNFPSIGDNCGLERVIIQNITQDTLAQGDTIVLTRVITAFDSCQNKTSAIQTIRLVPNDQLCPVVCPPDTFLGCNPTSFPDPLPGDINGIEVTFSDDTTFTDCQGMEGPPFVNVLLTRTYVFTSDSGFKDSCQQSITWAIDTIPPDLTALALDTTLCPFDPYLDTVNFIPIGIDDNCGIEQVLITELSRDTIANGDTILITRSIAAIDSCQNEASAIQTIRLVTRSLDCPIVCPPDTFLRCNPVAFPDPLPDMVNGISVSFTDDTTFTNCFGDPTAPLVNVEVVRTYLFTADFGLRDSCQQVISWKNDTIPPLLTALPLDTILCPLDPYLDTVNFIPIGIDDNCGIEQVQVRELSRDTVANGDTILITRSITAIDSCQNEASAIQTIRLSPRSEACTVVCPPDTFLACNPIAFPDPLPDNVNGVSVTFSDDTTFTNCLGDLTEPFVNVEVTRTYVFTTDFGLRDSCQQIISWKNDTVPPDLTALPLDTTLCPFDPYLDTVNFIPIGIDDNCGIEQVQVTEFSRDTTANGDTILISRLLTAIDSCANTSSATQTIRLLVNSLECPFVCPADTFLGCNPIAFPDPLPEEIDGVAVSFSDDTLATDCAGMPLEPLVNFEITRTYIFTPSMGPADTCQQIISWKVDTIPPIIAALPLDSTLCPDDPYLDTVNFFPPEISDNCGIEQVDVTELSRDTIANGDTILITRLLTAFDSCANTASATQTIRIITTEGGLCDCPPDMDLGCIGPDELPPPLTDVDFPLDQIIGFTETTDTLDRCEVVVVRNYDLLGAGGDTTECVQTLTYKDATISPIQINSCDTIVLFNDFISSVDTSQLELSGGCGNVSVQVSAIDTIDVRPVFVNPSAGNSPPLIEFERTIIVEDECGNVDSCIQRGVLFQTLFQVQTLPCNTSLDSIPPPIENSDLDSILRITGFEEELNIDADPSGCQTVFFNRAYDISILEGVLDSTFTQSITWTIDTVPPVIVRIPADTSFTGPIPAPDLGQVEATDNCGFVQLSVEDDSLSLGCTEFQIIRAFIATDGCGNADTATQILRCMDCSIPVPALADTTVCAGDPLTLYPNARSEWSYSWTPANGVDNDTLPSPQFIGDTTTTFTVTIIRDANDRSCDTVVTGTVEVLPALGLEIVGDSLLFGCQPDTVQFNATASDNATLIWSDTPTFSDTLAFGEQLNVFSEQDQSYFVQAFDQICTEQKEVQFDLVAIEAELPDSIFLCDDPGQLTVVVTNLDTTQMLMLEWLLEDPNWVIDEQGDSTIISTEAVGDLPVMVSNQFGCIDTLTTFLSVVNLPDSNIAIVPDVDTVTLLEGDTLQLNVRGCPSCEFFDWSPASPDLSASNIRNPILTANDSATYVMSTGIGECIFQDTLVVNISDACDPLAYWFPNSFFPEGATEVNHTFGVQSNVKDQILEYRLAIYNRWGEKIFETNDPAIGWDGRHRSNDADSGVYAYTASIVCIDGTSLGTFQGNLTLIR